ncbi:globin [Streptomyces sp. Ru73]|uniref:globin domain-containing protein n=1 Tax=Streptomyces sp. Ru73 TaxID=2080748 RepID=UPI000CDDD8EB|nr:globin domain-containing protein [Streptomyces sp. Ru73]POX43097.1 globin [Streptomyces sp. Ru73]
MTFDPALIKSSYAAVEPHGTAVTKYFYAHLFAHHPEVRPLFARHLEEQEDRLWNAIGALVANVEDTDTLVRILQGLGARHAGYGARPEHFPAVGASLVAALAHFAGDAWTPETEASWGAVHDTVTAVMTDVMAKAGAA